MRASSLRAIGIAALLALAGVLAAPSAALAAPATQQVSAPATAVTAWLDIEQSGLTASQLVVEHRQGSGTWSTVPLTQTTLGLHGQVAVVPGALELRFTPTANITPDLAVTFFDSAGAVVVGAAVSMRLELDSGERTDPNTRLSATGVGSSAFGPIVVGAAILLVGGAAVFVSRVRVGRRESGAAS